MYECLCVCVCARALACNSLYGFNFTLYNYFNYYLLLFPQAKEGENLVRLPYTSATATLMQDGKVFLTPDLVIEGESCPK